MVFQADTAAGLDQVLAPDAAKLGVVPDQIGELAALVDEIAAPQSVDFGVERGHAEPLGEHNARIVEAQCLVEVRRHEKMPQRLG